MRIVLSWVVHPANVGPIVARPLPFGQRQFRSESGEGRREALAQPALHAGGIDDCRRNACAMQPSATKTAKSPPWRPRLTQEDAFKMSR